MSYVLSKTHPAELSQVLQTAIQTATPDEIQAVTKLLGPLFPKALDKKACCDKQYIEAQNTNSSCQVEHCAEPEEYEDEDGYFDDYSDYDSGIERYLVIYPCCEEVYDEDRDEGPERYICYRTRHTTDPTKVDDRGYMKKWEEHQAKRAKIWEDQPDLVVFHPGRVVICKRQYHASTTHTHSFR